MFPIVLYSYCSQEFDKLLSTDRDLHDTEHIINNTAACNYSWIGLDLRNMMRQETVFGLVFSYPHSTYSIIPHSKVKYVTVTRILQGFHRDMYSSGKQCNNY